MGTLTALALIVAMFVILGAGVWIGIAVLGVAWLGMELFTTRPGGDALALTVWGSLSSWTLTALPLFIWMGEILLKSTPVRGHVPRPGAVAAMAAGAAAAYEHHRLHDLRRGVGLVGRHLRDGRQDHAAGTEEARLPRADRRSDRSPARARSDC